MNKVVKKGMLSTLLAVILLLSMTTIAIAASQLWYLDSASHAEEAGRTVMEKTIGAQSGSVSIGAGSENIWLAEHNTTGDAIFPGGSWIIEIGTDSDWGTQGDKCEMIVGGWDADLSSHASHWYDILSTTAATVTWSGSGEHHILKVELQAGPATIDAGDYLALKIKNDDSSSHEIHTDGGSSVRSSDSDPGYPVPELATVALMGAGLLFLGGYVALRKRRNRVTVA